jgi:penicillin-binding protein 2
MKRLYQQTKSSTAEKNGSVTYQSDTNRCHQRTKILLVGLFVLLSGISFRVFHLQIVQGAQMRSKSDSNRILTRSILPARGIIYDAADHPLVTNQPVQRLLTNNNGQLVLDSDILSREEVLRLEASSSGRLVTNIGRYYPYGSSMAHIVGYVAEADQNELSEYNLSMGEMVGKAGIEKFRNHQLLGVPGEELVELDARGKVLRRITQKDPLAGPYHQKYE